MQPIFNQNDLFHGSKAGPTAGISSSLFVEYAFFFHSEVIIVFFYYQLFDHVSLKPSRETLLCQMAQISIHNPE